MKALVWILLALALGLAALLVFGPREPVDREIAFDAADLGEDLDAWLAAREAAVPNLRPGGEKRILWSGAPGERTPLSIVYLHGFSASSEEIRPVPDEVAAALGSNLYFIRLAGHGRDGPAMAEPVAGDWIEDAAEALAIGRRLGERVLVIATSTGGALAAIVAADPVLSQDVAGVVLVSPNFDLVNPAAALLSLPFARHFVPLLIGPERGFEPRSADHAAAWTTRYPSIATIPMKALADHARGLDFGAIRIPALFLYSTEDQVVAPAATARVAAAWGGPVRTELRRMGPSDDPASHVIAGDILSPGQSAETARIIIDWATGL
ncbi:carboxylesterase [Tropicimonas sp. IMCC6043]|uniref:alpha/beta hydrolase n=1 Tax=Tropicimonas sp. IMCC6043 TaxID=2510645 RepID=UPI00101DB881|nr:alpha/beta fold hydrolase [Tropicimonas sp. IMCC6043]RYH08900.1 alpha/beta hydrolase [Tropicimonas sp. IMCC6043]